MTAAAVSPRDARPPSELGSLAVTVVMVLVALGLGWGLKASIETASIQFDDGVVQASVPDGWLVERGTGELRLVATDVRGSQARMSVSTLESEGRDLASLAGEAFRSASSAYEGLYVISEGPVTFADRDAYRFEYEFVDTGAIGEPVIRRGTHLYIGNDGSSVVLVTYHAAEEAFDDDIDAFLRLADSVRLAQ